MQPFSVYSWPKAIAHVDADAFAAGKIVVFLKTQQFITSYVELKLTSYTNLPLLLEPFVKEAFDVLYKKEYLYRQTGVVLSDLTTKVKYDLFNSTLKIKKIVNLYSAVDEINKKFGRSAIHLAISTLCFKDKRPPITIPVSEMEIREVDS